MDLSDSFKILYSLIHDLVHAEHGVSTAEIVARYGVSRRLVPKYMNILEHGGVPIYYDKKRWFVTENFATPFTLTVVESEIMSLALDSFRHQHPSHWRTTGHLLHKITDHMVSDVAHDVLAGFPGSDGVHTIEQHFKLLATAKRNQEEVLLDYRPLWQTRLTRWRIRPLLFTRNPHSDGIYLVCNGQRDQEPYTELTLKLDRILDVTLTTDRFDRPPLHVLSRRVRSAWGIWQGDGQQVELLFDARHEQRLRESQWHTSQAITKEPDNRLRYKVTVGDWREMVPWIRSWGSGVEVLAPDALRRRVINSLRRQMRVYGLDVVQDTADPLEVLWAKYDQVTEHHHLLIYHLLDVAAVAVVMWQQVLSASQKAWLGELLEMTEDGAIQFIALLVGLHDIGKATADFQRKATPLYEVLLATGVDDVMDMGVPHGISSKSAIAAFLVQTYGLERPVANRIGAAIGGHHGQWVSNREAPALMSDAWQAVQSKLILRMRDVIPAATPPGIVFENVNVFATFLSGFTSVCDWIGSNETYFPYFPYVSELHPVTDYWEWALDQASYALSELGWFGWSAPGKQTQFSNLFGFDPNALQRSVIDTITQTESVPQLVMIEYLTGGGKTEAAFYLADYYLNQLGLAGIYVAMPTQATGNQMFRRFADYLSRRYPEDSINLQLIHAQADAHPLYKHLRVPSERTGDESGLVAEDWFRHRKRTLLSPMGVGTVDQAMLGVLQARHHFVRQFALSHKVVVFDEIHAYDTYMSTIIERLLAWLRVLQAPVIMLSATLPSGTRQSMLLQYGVDPETLPDVPYPRLTVVHDGTAQVVSLPPPASRVVSIEYIEGDLPTLRRMLTAMYRQGGCIAVICNTVDEAITIAKWLRQTEGIQSDDIYLFHARFPPVWRDDIEHDVLALFGKNGDRPERAILVATQIIEQSLDLDFDLMVSRTAPIDMIVQRVGRLHRHERQRPEHLQTPTLLLRKPDMNAVGVPDFGVDEFVYEPYILLRTWAVLNRLDALRMPDQLDALIETVYSETEVAQVSEAYEQALAEAHHDFLRHRERDTYRGGLGLIASPDDERLIGGTSLDLPDDADDVSVRIATRDIEPGVDVICLHEVAGQVSVSEDELLPIDLSQRPNADEVTWLNRLRVSLRNRMVIRALEGVDVPAGWQRVRSLRHARALVFQEGVYVDPNGEVRLHLSRENGLEIIREK